MVAVSPRHFEGLAVMRQPCSECLFSRRRVVDAERKAEILAACARNDTSFNCHKGTAGGEQIVCAGFAKRGTSQALRMATAMKLVVLVDPQEGT